MRKILLHTVKRSRALVQKKLLFQKSSSRWGIRWGAFSFLRLPYVCMYWVGLGGGEGLPFHS